MSWDLNFLWSLLSQIVGSMQTWFSSLWSVAQSITNTGQGVFSGLVALGSAIWDGIVKFAQTVGQWFYNAIKWIYDGLCYIANVFGQWVSMAFGWIGSAVSWVAQQIYNFGNWLYNGMLYIWNWIVNTAQAVWGAIGNFFSGVASAIGSWWGNVVNGVNSWFTGLITGIRRKITQTLIADVSIYFGWKSMEKITSASSIKDAGFGVLGLLGSPFIGYLFANIINGLIPSPSTTPIQLIPSIAPFTYSPPSLTIATPIEKPYPSIGQPLKPLGYFAGVVENTIKPSLSYDVDMARQQTKTANITTSFDLDMTTQQTKTLSIDLSYEVVVS